MIVIPIFFVKENYPSSWSIIICFGAALYIYSGSFTSYTPIINRFFSTKPLVYIGLISFSLYLWHWPIIAFVNFLSIPKTTSVCIVILILSFLLSSMTYLLIEKPFRFKYKLSLIKSVFLLWITPLIISIIILISLLHTKNPPNKFDFNFGFQEFDKNHCFLLYETDNFKSFNLPDPKYCTLGSKNDRTPTEIAIIGDSHTRSETPMISVWLKNLNQKAYVVTQNSTPFLYDLKNEDPWVRVSAINRNNAIKKEIKTKQYKYIILGGAWSATKPDYSKYINSLEDSIKLITQSNAIPIIILDTPELPQNLTPLCNFSKISMYLNRCELDKKEVLDKQKPFDELVKKLKIKYPQLVIIDPKKVICNKSKCEINIDGTPLYADSQHLNYLGSKLIGELYLKCYGNPLAQLFKTTNNQ